MGKGSNVLSSKPIFRTGNIVCPPSPKVTKPKGQKADIIAPDPLTTVTSNDMNGFKIAGRESFAIERANAAQAQPAQYTDKHESGVWLVNGKAVVRTEGNADNVDPDALTYGLGIKEILAGTVRVEGTLASRPRRATVEAVRIIAQAAPKAERAQKIARDKAKTERAPLTEAEQAKREANRVSRQREDEAIRAYLRSLGYTGKIDARKRSLALDALTHAATVAAYGKGKRSK